ncbi:MAG: HAD family hydrolase [Calditrichaeota bacterium]|nr:MAG: HAD family hydrolase [Calditrichota bacterium]
MKANFTVQLLIFDLDGTIIDTRQDLTAAVNYALGQLGMPELDEKTVTSYVGDGITRLLQRVLHEPEEQVLKLGKSHFTAYYAAHLADNTRPYPGIVDMLEHFSGLKMALVTNKSQEFTLPLLEKLGLRKYFLRVIGGHAGFPAKPSPEAILNILASLGVSSSSAVMIGDSRNDILAGQAAKVHTCAVSWGYRPLPELLELEPEFVVHHPEDLIALFDSQKKSRD